MLWYGVASYAIAALANLVVAALLILSRVRVARSRSLLAAAVVTTLWAIALAVILASNAYTRLLVALDAVHLLVWILCILAWLTPATDSFPRRGVARVLAACAVVLCVLAAAISVTIEPRPPVASVVRACILLMTLVGILAVEQVLRNASEEMRRHLLLLCAGIGGVFLIDLVVYAQATLFGGYTTGFWESRGLVNAVLAPLIVVALKRQPEWREEFFISRHVVFYTTSFLLVGCYLVAMGAVASILAAAGWNGGPLLQIVVLVAAVMLFAVGFFSSTLRRRIKAFIVKNFYRNRYDYRHEWLRLTEKLGRAEGAKSLASAAVQGIADIVGSDRCELWFTRDGGQSYEWMVSTNPQDTEGKPSYTLDHPMVAFLSSKRWVIDTEEYRREPDRYGNALGHPDAGVLPPAALVVPLECGRQLLGLATLSKPADAGALNFEDHDILKTAGRQVAAVLAQACAEEQLIETRQFHAMSKLATFLMHDMKNVVAQQELVVANAQRFRHRPEFFDDAIATVRSSAERMRRIIDQLHGVSHTKPGTRADVSKVLMEVRSRCADRLPVPELQQSGAAIWVNMDRETLTNALLHLVRNAQDATLPDGQIRMTAETAHDQVTISVADSGSGMDAEFIRKRLFKPFDSTKGEKGMGIGAYQVRDTIRAAGGEVEVVSAVGVGTTFRLRIPLAVPNNLSDSLSAPASAR